MKSKIIFVLFLIVKLNLLSLGEAVVIQDLGGTTWHAFNQNKTIKVGSKVPGSIYTDLMTGGVLKGGHLYDNFNDLDYRWVAYESWSFEREFDVSEDVLKHEHVYLTAHGLDTIGQVTLNGHLLGSVENMFVRYKWPVKQLLKAKNNSIQVNFESPTLYGIKRHFQSMKDDYPLPPGCRPAIHQGECYVNYLRKMQASFSWDWGVAFPTSGIWRPITLEAYDHLLLRTVTVGTLAKSLKDNHWTLNTTVWLENVASANLTAKVALNLANSALTEKQVTVHFDHNGEAFVNILVDVPEKFQIKPWFPNGMGEQHLYDLQVTVSNEKESVSKSMKIGFRTIELSQEELPSQTKDIYNAYYFKVNNVPMYSKGINWIPAHVLYEALTDQYIYDMLLSSKLANMNMIRVWGGGYYEDDRFYEIADELGILIYQDMMFASHMYPGDDEFMANVATEIRQQIRRLQRHPSVAVWSGNNENEDNLQKQRWQELHKNFERYKKDYLRLTIDVTMKIIEHEDPSRPFVASCPSIGVADARKGYINRPDKRAGDFHFYLSSGNAWDWRHYPSAKFVSEYGFQSLSSVNLMEQYVAKDQLAYPLTHGLNHRQRCCTSLYTMMKEVMHMPKAGGIDALDDFVYLSQVFQAMSVKIETEFYRRNRKLTHNGEGFTMGALIWQLNEIWPGFSWSSLEFGGKWKILHYFIQKFFDNYLVDTYEDGHNLNVVIVRDDHQHDQHFTTLVNVYDWSSQKPIHTEKLDNVTHAFSVNHVYEHDMANLLTKSKCTDRNQCFIEVEATGPNGILRKNFHLLGKLKDAHLKKATIKSHVLDPITEKQSGQNQFTIQLETDHIAPFVWVDIKLGSKVEGRFSDNGFMLIDKHSLTFTTKSKLTATEVSHLLKIKTISSVNFDL